MENNHRRPYTPPRLEPQTSFTLITGATVPIGTSVLADPFEFDFMEEQQ